MLHLLAARYLAASERSGDVSESLLWCDLGLVLRLVEESLASDQALQLMTQLLWTSFLVAAPLLVSTLIVGVLVGVMQVVTQLQEMSLSYVPKLIAAFFVLLIFGPWMLSRLIGYATTLYGGIAVIR